MATLTITIDYDDSKAVEIRNALCLAGQYLTTIDDGAGNQIPNPQTKTQFFTEMCKDHLKTWIKNTYKDIKDKETLESIDNTIILS